MARGRVFDSEASGSGSRGGRGRGCSTRGRGGTIPLLSLCSASCAAITSFCSFLFYPTFWTSRVFTSFTVTYCTSETGSDGAGPSRHTDGSVSAIETSRLLAEKYGREPTPMEVFTYTHTQSHDGNTFVDRRAGGGKQPLSSPDPDTVDDTLVTLAETTTHPAGTPPGDSTLDRADDQRRRFDFGPF
ncbi:hypothetical protein JCGZ_06914 [Jatropha curcas]|uniref:Uncharacterized protein n=1 Tax=Jatropha curcas TaxID=180498 RepID=A0A067L040_JATCU|nr:hypothetical protein JCGZ_06914 [Jatropha curcas]